MGSRTYPRSNFMMRQIGFLMQYQAQGAGRSFVYGQALQRRSAQKAACPSGLRQIWRATSSNPLAVVPATARGIFLLSRQIWRQRIQKLLLG
jgi:hypothetical protein